MRGRSAAVPATVSGEFAARCHCPEGEKAVVNGDPRARRPACIETFARRWAGIASCEGERDPEPLSLLLGDAARERAVRAGGFK